HISQVLTVNMIPEISTKSSRLLILFKKIRTFFKVRSFLTLLLKISPNFLLISFKLLFQLMYSGKYFLTSRIFIPFDLHWLTINIFINIKNIRFNIYLLVLINGYIIANASHGVIPLTIYFSLGSINSNFRNHLMFCPNQISCWIA